MQRLIALFLVFVLTAFAANAQVTIDPDPDTNGDDRREERREKQRERAERYQQELEEYQRTRDAAQDAQDAYLQERSDQALADALTRVRQKAIDAAEVVLGHIAKFRIALDEVTLDPDTEAAVIERLDAIESAIEDFLAQLESLDPETVTREELRALVSEFREAWHGYRAELRLLRKQIQALRVQALGQRFNGYITRAEAFIEEQFGDVVPVEIQTALDDAKAARDAAQTAIAEVVTALATTPGEGADRDILENLHTALENLREARAHLRELLVALRQQLSTDESPDSSTE